MLDSQHKTKGDKNAKASCGKPPDVLTLKHFRGLFAFNLRKNDNIFALLLLGKTTNIVIVEFGLANIFPFALIHQLLIERVGIEVFHLLRLEYVRIVFGHVAHMHSIKLAARKGIV